MAMRIFLLVLMLLMLGATGVLGAPVEIDDCTESCPGDAAGDEGSPLCDYCACCLMVRPIAVPLSLTPDFVPTCEAVWSPSTHLLVSSGPTDIFQPPRLPA